MLVTFDTYKLWCFRLGGSPSSSKTKVTTCLFWETHVDIVYNIPPRRNHAVKGRYSNVTEQEGAMAGAKIRLPKPPLIKWQPLKYPSPSLRVLMKNRNGNNSRPNQFVFIVFFIFLQIMCSLSLSTHTHTLTQWHTHTQWHITYTPPLLELIFI